MFENIGNTITHLAVDQLGRNLADRIPSRSWPVRHNAVAMATTVAWQRRIEHSAVMGVWTSEGRTHEPILIKFGTQLQITTSMIVTWSNINIYKIQMADGAMLENVGNVITRLPMYRYGRNLGGHIPSRSWHVRHNAVAMATAVA